MNLTIQIGTVELIILSIIFVALLGLVAYLLLRLNKKIEDVGKPKFGFLGKTLTYSIITLTIGIGAVIFVGVNLSNVNNGDNRTNADNRYQADFQTFIGTSTENELVKLELSGVVMEDGLVWGDSEYELTWTFVGLSNTINPVTETLRGRNNPSFITVNLPRDIYSITLKAKSATTLVTKTKEIDLRYK